MKPDQIKWTTSEQPATEEMIATVERELGVRYPDDFRALAPAIHGGQPSASSFSYHHPRIGSVGTGLAVVLSFDPGSSYNVLHTLRTLDEGLLPAGVVPLGEDAGGDLLAFDFRTDVQHPTVVYVALADAEEAGARHIYPLATTFTEFLGLLTEG